MPVPNPTHQLFQIDVGASSHAGWWGVMETYFTSDGPRTRINGMRKTREQAEVLLAEKLNGQQT